MPALHLRRRSTGPSASPSSSAPQVIPPDWPSGFHNKCSKPRCTFPNEPQCVDGSFKCKGVSKGRPCTGIFVVPPQQAKAVTDWPSPLHHKCTNSDCYHPNEPQCVEGTFECKGLLPSRESCTGVFHVSTVQAALVTESVDEERAYAEKRMLQRHPNPPKFTIHAIRPTSPPPVILPMLRKSRVTRDILDETISDSEEEEFQTLGRHSLPTPEPCERREFDLDEDTDGPWHTASSRPSSPPPFTLPPISKPKANLRILSLSISDSDEDGEDFGARHHGLSTPTPCGRRKSDADKDKLESRAARRAAALNRPSSPPPVMALPSTPIARSNRLSPVVDGAKVTLPISPITPGGAHRRKSDADKDGLERLAARRRATINRPSSPPPITAPSKVLPPTPPTAPLNPDRYRKRKREDADSPKRQLPSRHFVDPAEAPRIPLRRKASFYRPGSGRTATSAAAFTPK